MANSEKDSRSRRLLPRHGMPLTFIEKFSQSSIKLLAIVPIYTALVVTLVLLLMIFGVPFVGGR